MASLAKGGEFDFEAEFEDRTWGASYFLITDFAEFELQPMLKKQLYENYPIYADGDGYLIFDLTKELDARGANLSPNS